MAVTKTTLEAYDSVDLTERQAEVLGALERLREASDQELAAALDWPINRVTPRRGELQALGLVHRARLKPGETGRTVSVWGLVPRQLPLTGFGEPGGQRA